MSKAVEQWPLFKYVAGASCLIDGSPADSLYEPPIALGVHSINPDGRDTSDVELVAHAGQSNVYTEDHLASRHLARIDKLHSRQIIFLWTIGASPSLTSVNRGPTSSDTRPIAPK